MPVCCVHKRNARKTHGFLGLAAQLMHTHTHRDIIPKTLFKWNHWGATHPPQPNHSVPLCCCVQNIEKTYMTLNVCSLRMIWVCVCDCFICLLLLVFLFSICCFYHFHSWKWCYVFEDNLWFHDKCVYLCLWLFSKIEYLPNIREIYYFPFYESIYEFWTICVTVFIIASRALTNCYSILKYRLKCIFVLCKFPIQWFNGDRTRSQSFIIWRTLTNIPTSLSHNQPYIFQFRETPSIYAGH